MRFSVLERRLADGLHGDAVVNHNQRFGQRGEDAAASWYEHEGYAIVDRNWRCERGEIDLIATDGEVVAFVEVKARSSSRYGTGLEAVGWRKQRTIRTVALAWLASADRYYESLRFDVVDVDRAGNIIVYEGCF